MGKQIPKLTKKEMAEAGKDEEGVIPSGQLLSCWNGLMLIITVLVAIIIAAVVTKAAELQDLNDEKDVTIDTLAAETEELKQKLYKSIADGRQQLEVKDKEIEKRVKDIQVLTANKNKSNEKIDKLEEHMKEKKTVIEDLNKEASNLNIDFANLNEKFENEKSRNGLLIEENTVINRDIFQKMEKIKILKKNEQKSSSAIKDKDVSIEKLENKMKTKEKEFSKSTNHLNKEIDKKDANIRSLELDVRSKAAICTEEKTNLENTISFNKANSDKELNNLERNYQDVLAKTKSKEAKTFREFQESIAAKEESIVEKSSLISKLKEQNLAVSEDLAKYSEEIQTQIRALQKEKEKCESDSKESEKGLLSKLGKEKERVQSILQEKEEMESILKNKYKVLEKEKNDKVKILENNKDQLLEHLKRERSEKNELVDGKLQLARQVENNKLEISQLEEKVNVVQVDIGNCIVEKHEENKKMVKLEKAIADLKYEKDNLESQCTEISKDLQTMKEEADTHKVKTIEKNNAEEKDATN